MIELPRVSWKLPLLLAAFGALTASGQSKDPVWVWNPRCPEPTVLRLEVRLDGTTLHSTSLSLCRWTREFEQGKAGFRFTASRPLVWYGYRSDPEDGSKDPGEATAAGTAFDVDFWQAGGEADAIELGYSVSAADGLHANSVHLVSPVEKARTTMAPGLVLETWPAKP